MKHLAYATFLLYWFAVLVPIEGNKTYIYNYTNFQEFFPQDKLDDFKLYKYENIEDHFKEKYKGPNIGGAWQMSKPIPDPYQYNCTGKEFDGNKATITTTYYCHGSKSYNFYFAFPDCGYPSIPMLCYLGGPYDERWIYNRSFNLTTCQEDTKVSRPLHGKNYYDLYIKDAH